MKKNTIYASYKNYMVSFDPATCTAELINDVHGTRMTMKLVGLFDDEGNCIRYTDFKSFNHSLDLSGRAHELVLRFSTDDENLPKPEVVFTVDARGITIVSRETYHYEFRAEGHITHGGEDSYAINAKDTPSDALRSGIGPTSSRYDNAIFDKLTDTAAVVDGCRGLSLAYDFEEKKYGYTIKTKSEGVAERIRFYIKERILTDMYAIDYAPMKKRGKYNVPPAGFMTWYSLKFGACEQKVLENARFMKDNLALYGANTVWVDWEWCHRRYERERFDGVDNFHPDPEKYPNGLGYVADEVKKLGLIPAVWLGFTNDACFTDYEREHPEISLSHHDTWSGRYYYDFSQPEYIDGYLVKAVQQVKDWGYEAVKYDTLPNSIYAHEKYHANMLHPEQTTYSAYRTMIKKTREILGEDYYMLSCGSAEEVILWGSGVFDAARIGPDLFTWEKYLVNLGRLRSYYALHTNVMYADPDCVVLRDEYSTYEQAKSRVVPVSMLGLPLNFGDDLTELPKERVDLLRRALPVLDVHPTDFNTPTCDGLTQLIVMNVARPFDTYTVVGLINLTGEKRCRDISLADSVRLEDGKYLAYDYFEKKFLGIVDNTLQLELAPYDSKVIALRKLKDIPQVISASRHISQGASEISDIIWDDKENVLNVVVDCIADEYYELTLYVPDGYRATGCIVGSTEQNGNLLKAWSSPPCNDKFDFVIPFEKIS